MGLLNVRSIFKNYEISDSPKSVVHFDAFLKMVFKIINKVIEEAVNSQSCMG